jgi:hypothetical protein
VRTPAADGITVNTADAGRGGENESHSKQLSLLFCRSHETSPTAPPRDINVLHFELEFTSYILLGSPPTRPVVSSLII